MRTIKHANFSSTHRMQTSDYAIVIGQSSWILSKSQNFFAIVTSLPCTPLMLADIPLRCVNSQTCSLLSAPTAAFGNCSNIRGKQRFWIHRRIVYRMIQEFPQLRCLLLCSSVMRFHHRMHRSRRAGYRSFEPRFLRLRHFYIFSTGYQLLTLLSVNACQDLLSVSIQVLPSFIR